MTGTEFPYTTSADPCNQPHSKPRNSAKVIVEISWCGPALGFEDAPLNGRWVMRILLGMVVMLMMSAGPLGDTYSQTYSREAMASQTPPPAAPKCEIQDARDCHVSKRKHEGIR